MSLSFLFKKILSADIKTQIAVGYLNDEGKLTDSGKLTLLQGLYEGRTDGSAYLTERGNALLAEQAANKS